MIISKLMINQFQIIAIDQIIQINYHEYLLNGFEFIERKNRICNRINSNILKKKTEKERKILIGLNL